MSATSAIDSPWYTQDSNWVLKNSDYQPDSREYFETVFTQSNGYMGVRGYPDEIDTSPSSHREGYLAGVFATMPPVSSKLMVHDFPWDSRQMVSMPEIFSAVIVLGGDEFDLARGVVESYEHTLDMRNGVSRREIIWAGGGTPQRKTHLTFTRFLSASNHHLAVQKVEIEPLNWSGKVEIIWEYDLQAKTVFRCGDPGKPRVACGNYQVMAAEASGSSVSGLVNTQGTNHQIAFASTVADSAAVNSTAEPAGTLSQQLCADVEEGSSHSFVRTTAIACSRDDDTDQPLQQAQSIARKAAQAGYETLAKDNDSVWTSRWQQSDIEIDGPAEDQVKVRFGIFSLLQVAPFHGSNLSIPARCYSWNRYNGHYFWDGEIFLLPFYQLCAPEVASNMLKFRTGTLPGARKNAALAGGKGALFPWQGDADQGHEQAPWGCHEHLWHQNADIIYAFDQYVRATGNEQFMFTEALETLTETARFWLSKLQPDEHGVLHVPECTGPDELNQYGKDNGYTGLMIKRSLGISIYWWQQAWEKAEASASEWAKKLDLEKDEISQWKNAAELIHIPEVPGLPGVPLQDAFFMDKKRVDLSTMTKAEFWQCRGEVQAIKQADIVLAMYLLEDDFSQKQISDSYEFYEPRTLHVSSLSYNTHSIVAAGLGKDEIAYDYFHKAAGLDLDNLDNATADGLHAAALGGVWQMALGGFMGMRIHRDRLCFKPSLPEAWKRMQFPVQYRGWMLKVEASADTCRIEVSGSGEKGAQVEFGGKTYGLTDGTVIE